MLVVISVVLFILKVTVLPTISWWIVALPVLIGLGIWTLALAAAGFAALIAWKFLD